MATRKLFAMPTSTPTAEPLIVIPEQLSLSDSIKKGLIGQDDSIDEICPFVEIHQAGLALPGRPAAVLLLLGPTGSGKTASVKRLAKCLHGNENSMIRIDCGEYQLDHEVAKIVGSPPGYLGHKETIPVLTQGKLSAAASSSSNLSILLFDEIEKASPAMTRILLGVMDNSTLKLGDNTQVNFDNTIIIMTSNLGAEQLKKETNPDFGFSAFAPIATASNDRLSSIGNNSAKKRLSPEFMNRIDMILTYKMLDKEHFEKILDLELEVITAHISKALRWVFSILLTDESRKWLVDNGFSKDYGARNLKRLLRKEILHPLALAINSKSLSAGDVAKFVINDNKMELQIV